MKGVKGPGLKTPPLLSHRSWQACACAGVVSLAATISSFLKSTLESAGGFSGNGCVGEYHSLGTSPLGTGRSSTPKIGLPVVRSRMNIQPVLPTDASAGIVFPLCLMSTRTGGDGMSESHRSWCTVWKCHLYLPVVTSTATIELANRLLPGRSPPQ